MSINNQDELSDKVRITSEVVHKSKTLIIVDCKIYDQESNALLAHGSHAKYLVKRKNIYQKAVILEHLQPHKNI